MVLDEKGKYGGWFGCIRPSCRLSWPWNNMGHFFLRLNPMVRESSKGLLSRRERELLTLTQVPKLTPTFSKGRVGENRVVRS